MALAICVLLLCISCATAQEIIPKIAPAVYVFGDSTMDSGNKFRGYPPPYGRTIPDYIASFLGLPKAPPYIAMTGEEKAICGTGINYAFAGSGVLPETQDAYQNQTYWGFDQQVELFKLTVTNDLPKIFGSPHDLTTHLAKSIFVVAFGINDYALNFLPPSVRSLSHLPRDVFAQTVLNALAAKLTTLYDLGARKVVVKNMWPLGCTPHYMKRSATCCDEAINEMVVPFYNALPRVLQDLSRKLSGSYFTHSNDFEFVKQIMSGPEQYGFRNTTSPCANTYPSDNCEQYLYYDDMHTTETASHLFALQCFNATGCSPFNIIQLVGKSPDGI